MAGLNAQCDSQFFLLPFMHTWTAFSGQGLLIAIGCLDKAQCFLMYRVMYRILQLV